MASGARRLSAQQAAQAQAILDTVPELPLATVTAVAPTGGTDGIALVTVDYLGATFTVPHLDSYTPAVNHRVTLARVGGILTVLGRPVGFPA